MPLAFRKSNYVGMTTLKQTFVTLVGKQDSVLNTPRFNEKFNEVSTNTTHNYGRALVIVELNDGKFG